MTVLSIILVNYNGENILSDCLLSIQQYADERSETIVIDNRSTDNSVELIESKFPWAQLICNPVNAGFGRANNIAVERARGEYLLFLNTDTILTEHTPQILLEYLQAHPDVGAIGSRIVFADGSYQLSAGKLPNLLVETIDKIKHSLDRRWHHVFADIYDRRSTEIAEVGWVTGACLMMCRDVFDRSGGFDEKFFMYFEDKDLCQRVRALGFKVIYYPRTSVIHLLGGSSHQLKQSVNTYYRDSQIYYYQKHLDRFQLAILKAYLKITGKS